MYSSGIEPGTNTNTKRCVQLVVGYIPYFFLMPVEKVGGLQWTPLFPHAMRVINTDGPQVIDILKSFTSLRD